MHINDVSLYLDLVMATHELVDIRDDLGKFTKEEKMRMQCRHLA
jgi:hypothetical protein